MTHRGKVRTRIQANCSVVLDTVAFRPFHRVDATAVAVAAPDNPGVRPMSLQALGHVLDDGPHLGALGGARGTSSPPACHSPRDRCASMQSRARRDTRSRTRAADRPCAAQKTRALVAVAALG
jgi:hypothetical protein